jgi:tryptophan aminotransferase
MSPALPKEYYKRFMSSLSENRHPSASKQRAIANCFRFGSNFSLPVRSILHLEQTPGLISFLSGKPAAATFPFTSFTVTIRDPIDPSKEEALTITGKLLEDSLQYTDTRGMHELLEWLHNLQEHFHGRKRGEGWRISMGAGSQDSLYKVGTFSQS